MAVIPNILHFIWIGTELPMLQRILLYKWIIATPGYEVRLWTDTDKMQAFAELMYGIFKRYDAPIIHHSIELIKLTDGYLLRSWTFAGERLNLYIYSIGAIIPLIDPALLYEEIDSWKNYGAASDILRISVLHMCGGIYSDIDIIPPHASLKLNIVAPKNVLFCRTFFEGMFKLLNCIIAAPAYCYELKSLASSVEHSYEDEFLFKGTGVRELTTGHWERHELVEKIRRVRIRKPDSEILVKALRIEMGNKTLQRTGPSKIRSWVQQREGTSVDVLYDSSVDMRHPTSTYDEATEILYSFQDQAGYYPEVLSLGSWVE